MDFLLGLILGVVGTAAALWGVRQTRRQQTAAGFDDPISDDALRILRLMATEGQVRESFERPPNLAGVSRTFSIGTVLIAGGVAGSENAWIWPALRELENAGLITAPALGSWPTPGPSKASITEPGRTAVRLQAKRKIPDRAIVPGRVPGAGRVGQNVPIRATLRGPSQALAVRYAPSKTA